MLVNGLGYTAEPAFDASRDANQPDEDQDSSDNTHADFLALPRMSAFAEAADAVPALLNKGILNVEKRLHVARDVLVRVDGPQILQQLAVLAAVHWVAGTHFVRVERIKYGQQGSTHSVPLTNAFGCRF
jgi:hypothetical protein